MTAALRSKLTSDEVQSRVRFRAIGGPTLREYFYYTPSGAGPNSPILVLVHGITRRAAEQIFRFRDEADRTATILVAPHFPKVIYGQYQQAIDTRGPRADLALIEILADVTAKHEARSSKVHLFGFSGGAQFAHRFALIHPERVASISLASAGWYTMPDEGRPYPLGIATHPVPGETFDLRAFLAIERHVYVGGEDRFQDDALRKSPRLDRLQGSNRVQRAKAWSKAMDAASKRLLAIPPSSTFEILKGVGHSFAGSAKRRSLPSRVVQSLGLGDQLANQQRDSHA
jgi:pimeloyl-ACP methyl ester carboxylesterase